jgi:hypothetical protein
MAMERGKALSTTFMLLPQHDESKIECEALFLRQSKLWLGNKATVTATVSRLQVFRRERHLFPFLAPLSFASRSGPRRALPHIIARCLTNQILM